MQREFPSKRVYYIKMFAFFVTEYLLTIPNHAVDLIRTWGKGREGKREFNVE